MRSSEPSRGRMARRRSGDEPPTGSAAEQVADVVFGLRALDGVGEGLRAPEADQARAWNREQLGHLILQEKLSSGWRQDQSAPWRRSIQTIFRYISSRCCERWRA